MKDLTTTLERELTRAIEADLVRAAPPEPPRRRRTLLPALAATTAAIAAGLALLPGGGSDAGSGSPTGADVLRAAAAVAAERGEDGFAGYRYVRVRQERDEPLFARGGRAIGGARTVQVEERWVDADWHGRVERGPARLGEVHGTAEAIERARRDRGPAGGTDRFRTGAESVYAVPLRTLPPDPARMRAAWTAALRARVAARGQVLDPAFARWDTVSSAVALLGTANVPAELRAAAFRLLADLDGAQARGRQRDRLGRAGVAVDVGTGSATQRLRVTVDPRTGALLETVVTVTAKGTRSVAVTTYDRAARVDRPGVRP